MDKSRVYCEARTHGERGDCEDAIGLLFRCGSLEYWFEVAECGTEWHDTSPHGMKKSPFVQQ